MRVTLNSAVMYRGTHRDAGSAVDLDDDVAQSWIARGWASPAPVSISSVAPPLAETLPAPAPDGDELAAPVESEPDPEPEAPARRRRSR